MEDRFDTLLDEMKRINREKRHDYANKKDSLTSLTSEYVSWEVFQLGKAV